TSAEETADVQQRPSIETGLAPSPATEDFNESRARHSFEAEEQRKEQPDGDDEAPEQQDRHDKYEQMNVAAIFGGAAADTDEPAVETGRAPSQENLAGQPPSPEEVTTSPETKFAPGFGHLEEEEIEEEEADTSSLQQEFEDAEFEELEEQIMDRVA